jgi:hypothetical protein
MRFYVYHDYLAGGNHWQPSGRIGDYGDITMDESWTTSPQTGLSCTRVHCSGQGSQGQGWAGVYYINGISFRTCDDGLNLAGATTFTVWVRGERNGGQIEVKVGGFNRPPYYDPTVPGQDSYDVLSTGLIPLTTSWARHTLRLQAARLGLSNDLSNMCSGMVWVAETVLNPGGTTFYLDEMYYDLSRPNALRLPQSYVVTNASSDTVFRNLADTYPAALTLLAYVARGTSDDRRRAGIIADTLVWAIKHDRTYPSDPASTLSLRVGYASGDISTSVTTSGGTARLPGWWDGQVWVEDAGFVGTSTGNVAWVMIALLDYYDKVGRYLPQGADYLNTAQLLGEWVNRHVRDNSPWGYKGYRGGYYADQTGGGWDRRPLAYGWKSTEHNLLLYSAFSRLYRVTRNSTWQERANHARDFVLGMWENTKGQFLIGTTAQGMIDTKTPALNAQSLAFLVLYEDPGSDSSLKTNTRRALDWARQLCAVYSKPCGPSRRVSGFDFNTDRDGVWCEGTAQMALSYSMLADTRTSSSFYIDQLRIIQQYAPNADARGIVATCNPDNAPLTTGLQGLDGRMIVYYNRLYAAATAWYIFAERRYNPFSGGPTAARRHWTLYR